MCIQTHVEDIILIELSVNNIVHSITYDKNNISNTQNIKTKVKFENIRIDFNLDANITDNITIYIIE